MAMAFTAWLIAPAPMACTSARPCSRIMPATAPATAGGLEEAETRSASTAGRAGGPAAGGDVTGGGATGCWVAIGGGGLAAARSAEPSHANRRVDGVDGAVPRLGRDSTRNRRKAPAKG